MEVVDFYDARDVWPAIPIECSGLYVPHIAKPLWIVSKLLLCNWDEKVSVDGHCAGHARAQ